MNETLKSYGPTLLATAALIAATPTMVATAAATSTELGSTFVPGGCPPDVTVLQTASDDIPPYAVPADGVITSWRYQASGNAQDAVGFRLGRAVTGGGYEIVGASANVVPAPDQAVEQLVRIPAKAGDVLGLHASSGECGGFGSSGDAVYYTTGDVTSGPMTGGMSASSHLDIAATLEPDADGDGYGDVTQDQCPTQAATAGPCVVAPQAPPAPPATKALEFTFTKAPTARGVATVGSRLRLKSALRRYVSPTPATLKIRWYANNVKIKGAKHRTYVVDTLDVGKKIKAKITVSGGAPTKTYTVTFKKKATA